MKVLAATLATLLLLATCSPAEGHLDGVPTKCCFTYQMRPILPQPPPWFTQVRWCVLTHGELPCSARHRAAQGRFCPGSVVTLRKKELCADPKEKWVQNLQKHFQNAKN
ncbi:C-C motif chemokine 13-like [Zonotrichia leucophrys gambelii]|uniref:C-C motif chemokine 13-like n=1 Tax=Zonotrichia leucophrys gambelii TaxID=257770 RepID=UPI0031409F69